MEPAADFAVRRVIATMWQRYPEPLGLRDLAEAALLSRFYLSRVFRAATGVSPFQFLTVIRLSEAKRLLRETSTSVTEIAYAVGYNSLGTFTTRFTRSVGASPACYRRWCRTGAPPMSAVLPDRGASGPVVMEGTVTVPRTEVPLRVFIGAFPRPVMEGPPVSWDVLGSSGEYRLTGPRGGGELFIRAAAVAVDDGDGGGAGHPRREVLVGGCQPSRILEGRLQTSDMAMKSLSPLDLPILLAIPELGGPRANPWCPRTLGVAP